MNEIASAAAVTTPERPAAANPTRRRIRRAVQTWNDLLDAGVEPRKNLPRVRDYPYPVN